MGLFDFFKKNDENLFEDLAVSINKKVDEKMNSEFYILDKNLQVDVDTKKIQNFYHVLGKTISDDIYHDWLNAEIASIIHKKEYLNIHTMSAIITYLAYIEENYGYPNKIRKWPVSKIFYTVYINTLKLRGLMPNKEVKE